MSSFLAIQSDTEDPAWNVIRLAGVNGPWLRQRLGISLLIKTEQTAKLFSLRGVILSLLWWAFMVPSLKSTASISLEIFFIQYCSSGPIYDPMDVILFALWRTFLVETLNTASTFPEILYIQHFTISLVANILMLSLS